MAVSAKQSSDPIRQCERERERGDTGSSDIDYRKIVHFSDRVVEFILPAKHSHRCPLGINQDASLKYVPI